MIIDGKDAIVGRLATFAAQQALRGEEVIIVNSEKAIIVGNPRDIEERYKQRINRGTPFKGPFYPRSPERILRRAIRGMLPIRKERGREAYKRIKCFIGIPPEYEGKDLYTSEEFRFKGGKFMTLKDISLKIGWRMKE